MEIELIQLSDIHIKQPDDVVLIRAEKIVAAILSIPNKPDLTIIAMSGDMAQAGKYEQYELAETFLESIRDGLMAGHNGRSTVEIALVPGNHDCDFDQDDAARKHFVDAFAKGSLKAFDKSIVDICVKVQSHFIAFRNKFAGNKIQNDSHLYYEYQYEKQGKSVLIRCLNTAWVSRIEEKPGTLYYPESAILDNSTPVDMAFTMLHHPFHWLEPNNAREVRSAVDKCSDIILTGHEHAQTKKRVQSDSGETNEYIEGGVLQESWAPDVSTFNVLSIRLDDRKQKFYRFIWDKEIYNRVMVSEDWEPFQINKVREQKYFAPESEFSSSLNDLGISITHPQKGKLSLSDIFVYPDVRKFDLSLRGPGPIINCEDILDASIGAKRIFLIGDDRSGKTSITKSLYTDLSRKGYVPILLNGKDLRVDGSIEDTEKALAKAFCTQYSSEKLERWRQLDISQKIVIVDNLHKLKLKSSRHKLFFESLERLAGKSIITTDEIEHQISEFVELFGDANKQNVYYKILPLGHTRRSELVDKWYSLSDNPELDDIEIAQKKTHAENLLTALVGKNFVPAFPVFVISALQAQGEAKALDTRTGTYGAYYEVFIKASLAQLAKTPESFDILVAYLSSLAYKAFSSQLKEFTLDFWRDAHESYTKKYAIRLEFPELREYLIEGDIIDEDQGLFKFKYNYLQYYFVASYLKDFISEQKIKEKITELSRSLHEEDSANILLFLAHLSKDPFIIDQMMLKAREIFQDFPSATLERDLDFLGDVQDSHLRLAYLEQSPDAAKKERLNALDTIDQSDEENTISNGVADNGNSHEEFELIKEMTLRIGTAFKTLEVLGQILKNFPGSIPADLKLEIANECCNVGLRTLGSFLTAMKNEQNETLIAYMHHISRERPELETDALLKEARKTIVGLTFLLSYGTIKKISSSIGTPKLVETYSELRKSLDTAAGELIHASLHLDNSPGYPQNEVNLALSRLSSHFLPKYILQQMVANYLYMYPINYQQKQMICKNVGIPYQQATDPRAHIIR